MARRRLPVHPDLDQLKHQAKDVLRQIRAGHPDALADLAEHHPDPIAPEKCKLADAQLVLARSYEAPSWPRLVQGVQLVEAIWRDDLHTVRTLIERNPRLLHEQALIRQSSNWGPPMTYAANLGRDRIIQMLHGMGAADLDTAMARAALQGKTDTALMLHELLGKPVPPDDALGGPAYTLNVAGTAMLLRLGVQVSDATGRLTAPVDVVLETDSRHPADKHAILEMYAAHGAKLPDTPTMALHRGRIDLLEKHLQRDPSILTRRFSHREIYPAEVGCKEVINATVGTPLDGTTLLHMCADYDELDIARWLLERGMDVDLRAAVGPDGFGGHTALFGTVVSQANFWMNSRDRGPYVAPMTALLLAHGADPNARASIEKQLHPGYDDAGRQEYHDVTALSYGRRFHWPVFVSKPALKLIEAAGGTE